MKGNLVIKYCYQAKMKYVSIIYQIVSNFEYTHSGHISSIQFFHFCFSVNLTNSPQGKSNSFSDSTTRSSNQKNPFLVIMKERLDIMTLISSITSILRLNVCNKLNNHLFFQSKKLVHPNFTSHYSRNQSRLKIGLRNSRVSG